MKGSIYCDQPCPVCGGKMVYDSRRSGCFCKDHPDVAASRRFRVRFKKDGKSIQRRFPTIAQAEQFLNGIRFKEGDPGENLDPKDYQKDNPLGFANLVDLNLAGANMSELTSSLQSWMKSGAYPSTTRASGSALTSWPITRSGPASWSRCARVTFIWMNRS